MEARVFTSVLLLSQRDLCFYYSPAAPSFRFLRFIYWWFFLSFSSFRGYLVAAPSVFRAGVEESVSVTIFGARAETRVQVQLLVKGQTVTHGQGSVLGENSGDELMKLSLVILSLQTFQGLLTLINL